MNQENRIHIIKYCKVKEKNNRKKINLNVATVCENLFRELEDLKLLKVQLGKGRYRFSLKNQLSVFFNNWEREHQQTNRWNVLFDSHCYWRILFKRQSTIAIVTVWIFHSSTAVQDKTCCLFKNTRTRSRRNLNYSLSTATVMPITSIRWGSASSTIDRSLTDGVRYRHKKRRICCKKYRIFSQKWSNTRQLIVSFKRLPEKSFVSSQAGGFALGTQKASNNWRRYFFRITFTKVSESV